MKLDPVSLSFVPDTAGDCAVFHSGACSTGLCHTASETLNLDLANLFYITKIELHLSDPQRTYLITLKYASNSLLTPDTTVPISQVCIVLF